MATEPPPSDAGSPSAEEFLHTVRRSGLVEEDRLRAALRGLTGDARQDAGAVAHHLIEGGVLSRFQANRLLRGVTSGLVLGPYHLQAPLGRGGMATVFLARDTRGGHLVALKVLSPRRARAQDRLRARFLREMALSTRVAHPHLAWTYEAGEARGVLYIAMEYIPGRTLARLVLDEGPLPVPRATRLLAEAAAGLEHAHNLGLIHRDLKPSNIMITPHDHAKVLDLGLALVEGEVIADHEVVGGRGYIVGTMDYIAPEQTTNAAEVDRRSDVYAMGGTLYYVLTGQPPFPGGNNRDKIRRHRTEEPVAVEKLRPDLPPGLGDVIRRMMAKDARRRYASAAAVADALSAWAREEPELPPDRPEDSAYAQAVDALRTATPDSEYTLPPLPEKPLLRRRRKGGMPVWLVALCCAGALWLLALAVVALMAWGVAGR
jgi:serine/threonine protein kinase